MSTPGAMRAAKLMAISPKVRQLAIGIILREEFSNELAEIIDRETGAPEMLEALRRVADSVWEPDKWRSDVEAAIQKARGAQ